MSRSILDEAHIHPTIRQTIADKHTDIVQEVQAAIAGNKVVVVGMGQNPFPLHPAWLWPFPVPAIVSAQCQNDHLPTGQEWANARGGDQSGTTG